MQFVGAADKAVALSLIVSAVVRGALAHIPLHLIKAPSIGSGKSFLVDLANVVATGQRCAAVAARSEKEKWERQIAMALHGGDPIVSLDNFNGELRSDLLAQRSEEHTSELQSLMRISYAVFCLKKKKKQQEGNIN